MPGRALPDALGSLAGAYDYLLGEEGTYSPMGPPFLNTLREMAAGQGYLIRLTHEGTLVY